jgi:L-threonylcarbamoyladenylate synthase
MSRAPILPADDAVIARAAEALRQGRLVGLPTETVYGLAADATADLAVAAIFAAKHRPTCPPIRSPAPSSRRPAGRSQRRAPIQAGA